jgi:circadian clock protein KaiB
MTPGKKRGTNAPPQKDKFLFRQYVAGKSPNSLQAVINFREICRKHFGDRCTVEVVDVLKEPMLALRDEIFVSPTLIKLSPPPVRKIIGDLSDEERVVAALKTEG